jgi:hypothetical protein
MVLTASRRGGLTANIFLLLQALRRYIASILTAILGGSGGTAALAIGGPMSMLGPAATLLSPDAPDSNAVGGNLGPVGSLLSGWFYYSIFSVYSYFDPLNKLLNRAWIDSHHDAADESYRWLVQFWAENARCVPLLCF